MKAALLAVIINALRLYIGAGLFTRVQAQVEALAANPSISGKEKMTMLLSFFSSEVTVLGETVIRAAAELILLKLKG